MSSSFSFLGRHITMEKQACGPLMRCGRQARGEYCIQRDRTPALSMTCMESRPKGVSKPLQTHTEWTSYDPIMVSIMRKEACAAAAAQASRGHCFSSKKEAKMSELSALIYKVFLTLSLFFFQGDTDLNSRPLSGKT